MRGLSYEEHEADGRQGVLQGKPQPQEVHQGEDFGRPQDLQLGVNITNFLRAQLLYVQIPKAQKIHPGVNFINVKHTNILYERRFGSFFLRTHVRTYVEQKLPK